jgi:hypothetical protein
MCDPLASKVAVEADIQHFQEEISGEFEGDADDEYEVNRAILATVAVFFKLSFDHFVDTVFTSLSDRGERGFWMPFTVEGLGVTMRDTPYD